VSAARVSGASTADTARARAAMLGGVAAAQRDRLQALNAQLGAARTTGNTDLVRSTLEMIQQAQTDIMNTMADAADAIREAAQAALQASIAQAEHASSMASYGMQELELRQQLGGTYDTPGGALARADYINTTIVPALTAELGPLRDALNAALTPEERAAAEEALAQQQIEILQAQLAAQEATQAATEATAERLQSMGGTLGFEFGGQQFTDLITTGIGA
jgi:hypothetical protein